MGSETNQQVALAAEDSPAAARPPSGAPTRRFGTAAAIRDVVAGKDAERRLAQMEGKYGGSITVESRLDEGSTVRFALAGSEQKS